MNTETLKISISKLGGFILKTITYNNENERDLKLIELGMQIGFSHPFILELFKVQTIKLN